jgi:uncharacterized RDD family membrane protein YckC
VEDVAYCPDCAALPGEDRGGVRIRDDQAISAFDLETLPCASLGSRFVAGLMDLFILGAAAIILAFLVWMFTGVPLGLDWTVGVNDFFWLVMFLGSGAYFAGYQATSGQTPGYAATDLKLVRRDGRLISPPLAVLRYLVSYLSAAFFMLGFLWVLWDPDNQSWHDKAADTLVLLTSERKDLPDRAIPVEPPPADDSDARPQASSGD